MTGLRFLGHLGHVTLNALYKLISRTALYVLTLYLLVYFTVNSDTFRNELMAGLSDAMPGHFDCASIQYGPLPWRVTLLDTEILNPEGGPAITVKRIQTSIDILALWGWALQKTVRGEQHGLKLVFKEVTIDGADVVIDVRKDGWVGIAQAFTDGRESKSEGPAPTIELKNINIMRSRVRVAVEGAQLHVDAQELNVVDAHVAIKDGKVVVNGGRILAGTGFFELGGLGPYGGPMQIPWSKFIAENTQWNHGLLKVDWATLMASQSSVNYSGAIDTRGKSVAFDFRASVQLDRDDPILLSYLRGVARLGGTVSAHFGGHSDALELEAAIEAEKVSILGTELGSFSLGMKMSPEEFRHALTGDLIELKPFSIAVLDGAIHVDSARFWPRGVDARKQSCELTVRFDNIAPGHLWHSGLIGDERNPPEILDGRLNGSLQSVAHLDTKGDEALWTVDNQADLTVDWPGSPTIPLLPVYGVFGDIRFAQSNSGGRLSFEHLQLFSGDDSAQLSGGMELPTGPLDVSLNATVNLVPFLSALGVKSISGRARLGDAKVTGSVLSPNIRGKLELVGAQLFNTRIDRLSTLVNLDEGHLQLDKLKIVSDMGRLQAKVSLQLWDRDLTQISKSLPLHVDQLRLSNFKLEKLGIDGLAGTAAVRAKTIKAKLGRPGFSPEGRVRLQVSNFRIIGEQFSRIVADISAKGPRIQLHSLSGRHVQGGAIRAHGKFNLDTHKIRLNADVSGMKLEELSILKTNDIPLRGRVDLKLEALGALTNLTYRGEITTRRFAFDTIQLGRAKINFERKRSARGIHLSSSSFFHSMVLKEGLVQLNRQGIPERLSVNVESKNTNLLEVLPMLRGTLHQLKVGTGDILFDLDFRGITPMRLIVDLPHNAVRARLQKEGDLITNNGPLWASLVGSVASIERYVVEWAGQRLSACGTINLEGPISLDVAGAVDLGQVDLRQYVHDLQGRLTTYSEQGSSGDPFDDSCLLMTSDEETLAAIGNPNGYLKIRHRLDAPSINGTFQLDDVRMALRDLNRDITLSQGQVVFDSSQDGKKLNIIIPQDNPFVGTFGDGSIELHGQFSLPRVASRSSAKEWKPDAVKLRIQGTSISWSVPKEYRVTFHPDLDFEMSGMYSGTKEAPPVLRISGNVEVTDGEYNKSFDRFAQALGSIAGRSVDAYSASLSDTIPELNLLKLGLNVSGSNFRVDSGFGVGSAVLESSFKVRVEGTLNNPQVNGRVEVNEGTIVYKLFGREFDIQRGSLDFDGDPEHPSLDIEAVADFEYQTRSRFRQTAEEESLAVTIKLSGRLPDLNVALSSNDASLSQVDLQYLILLGVTKSDFEERGVGDKSTLDIVGANITNLVTKVLRAPFLEKVTITPTAGGGSELNVITRLGRAVRFGVTSTQEGSESSYNVLFRYKISDRLSLEGTLRPPTEDEEGRQKYNAKLKYSIPLD
jgi:hypothetical protein